MSETARLLADSVETFLARNAKRGADEFFIAVEESGFALALASEDQGGLGASFSEAATIARAWGYHAAALPIVEMLLAGRLAAAAGEHGKQSRLTVASGCTRDGSVIAAQFPGTDLCIAPAKDGPGTTLLEVEGTNWTTIAEEAMVSIPMKDGAGKAISDLPTYAQIVRQGAILTTARMLGAMERVVQISTDHVKVRSQFGRPLAKFQLVQTMISDAAAEVDATRAVLERALVLLDAELPDELVWRAAKAQAGRGATLVAANAHQALGAIGFTQEHILHRLTRRLWAWRDTWLAQSEAEEAVGAQACAAGPGGLWRLIADAPQPQEREG